MNKSQKYLRLLLYSLRRLRCIVIFWLCCAWFVVQGHCIWTYTEYLKKLNLILNRIWCIISLNENLRKWKNSAWDSFYYSQFICRLHYALKFAVLKVKRRVRLEGAELEDHMKKEKEKEAEIQRIKMEQARR